MHQSKNENTAASAYRFLRVFIKDSFEPDTGDYELFFQIKKYSVLEKDPVLYTAEQLTCFLSAAKKDNTSHYLEYALALYCGLKPGEILGLKYDSFDPEAGTVTICGLHARNMCLLTEMGVIIARISNTVAESSVQTVITVLCLFRNFYLMRSGNGDI